MENIISKLFGLLLINGAVISEPLCESLWGKKVDFMRQGCSAWKLTRPVPALDELSVCVQLQRKITTPWTAFMYSHETQPAETIELGLTGKHNSLHVWHSGRQWTAEVSLPINEWCTICFTVSSFPQQVNLYINGSQVESLVSVGPSDYHSCCQLKPGGTLTLGASHYFSEGVMIPETGTNFQGSITLFRVWGEVLTQRQLNGCLGGNVVSWDAADWDYMGCPPVRNSHEHCAWSLYELRVNIIILRWDNLETNEYTARDLVRTWAEKELPTYMSVYSVFVSGIDQSTPAQHKKIRDISKANRFSCSVYLNVLPSSDVSVVQLEVCQRLQVHYSIGMLSLIPDNSSICVSPTDSLPISTLRPSTVTGQPIHTTPLYAVSTEGPITGLTPVTTSQVTFASSFFSVELNITVDGSDGDPQKALKTWLSETLSKERMFVLNFHLLAEKNRLRRAQSEKQITVFGPARHSCGFQVHANTSLNTDETKQKILSSLEAPYPDMSINNISITHIEPGPCPKIQHQTREGLFLWNQTPAEQTATLQCEGDVTKMAQRQCVLAPDNHARWKEPELHQCPVVVETIIPDLDNINVTADNAADVLVMIEDLIKDHKNLDDHELDTILNKLADVLNITVVTPDLAEAVIKIISDILHSGSHLQPVTNKILNITETIGDKLSGFTDEFPSLFSQGLSISVVDVDSQQFQNLTFGVSSVEQGQNMEIYINQEPFDGTVAFISLPPDLKDSFPQNAHNHPSRIQFQFYRSTVLFQDTQKNQMLNTYVVSASVTNATGPIKDLMRPVAVTLHHLNSKPYDKEVQCVFWNFNKNDGLGGWDSTGCWKHNTSTDLTTCLCNHLTHFGVLLDISRTPIDETNEKILTIISYIGCGVSSVFLGITILTYTAFEKLRRDYPSKILLNLAVALKGLNLIFLLNSWFSSFGSYGLCVAVAATMHYFLLASFTWMGLEAVNMYMALVKVFNSYVPSYILKFCIIGWGVPLIVCGSVLIIKRETYGGSFPSTSLQVYLFCWVQDDVAYYVTVVGYIFMVLLFNTAVFLVVLVQLRHMRANRPAGTHSNILKDLRGVASITFLLGLTWCLALFAWEPAKVAMLYLFSILNSLQGFFIFLFHCLMKENVRKQWRVHLCFGRFRIQDYSEWSQTATVPAKPKPHQSNNFPSMKSVSSNKSNTTESTSASSESSQREVYIMRPKLGVLCQTSLALPRAQYNSSPQSQHGMPCPQDHTYEVYSWLPKAEPH